MMDEPKLDETFSLKDHEAASGGEVSLTERQYRAAVLDFLNNDGLIGINIWAGTINVFCRDGWEGPTYRHIDIETGVKNFFKMAVTKHGKKDDFEDLLLHLLQTRLALRRSLEWMDKSLDKEVAKRDDGTQGEA